MSHVAMGKVLWERQEYEESVRGAGGRDTACHCIIWGQGGCLSWGWCQLIESLDAGQEGIRCPRGLFTSLPQVLGIRTSAKLDILVISDILTAPHSYCVLGLPCPPRPTRIGDRVKSLPWCPLSELLSLSNI